MWCTMKALEHNNQNLKQLLKSIEQSHWHQGNNVTYSCTCTYTYMENGKKCNVYYNDSLQEKQWMKK